MEPLDALRRVSYGLSILIGLTYIAFTAYSLAGGPDLPGFILAENVVYGLLLLSLPLIMGPRGICIVALVAAFSSGRVSRSVITPTGELSPAAADHVGILAALAALAVVSAAYCLSRKQA
ncbi:MAG: hypothetical protein LRS43_03305 [Desulfurococcales archaeon]|nr:hypothetical protein [Desulfurococcales archaeon]